MPMGPAARVTDPVLHLLPGILQPGPGAPTVWIGMLPAWRGIPGAAVGGLQAAKSASDMRIQAAQAATLAAAGTPGFPAAKAAEETLKAAEAAAMAATISAAAAASGSDIHICVSAVPLPLPPPHGPGVVIDGSPTVFINNLHACRVGDTILEAFGPPNKIIMGCPTVIIGDRGGGAGGGGGGLPVAPPAPGDPNKVPGDDEIPDECGYLKKGETVEATDAQFDRNRKATTLSRPKEIKHTFPGDTQPSDALEYEVDVDGQKVKVITPKTYPTLTPPKTLPSAESIARGLGAVPPGQLTTVKEVVISPNQNPSDPYWAEKYKTPGFVSGATGGAGGVTFYPNNSNATPAWIDSTLIHEGGHTYQQELWKDAEKKKKWEQAMKSDPRSPSNYADNDIAEDFSEAMVAYALSKGTICEAIAKRLFPARYAILDELNKK